MSKIINSAVAGALTFGSISAVTYDNRIPIFGDVDNEKISAIVTTISAIRVPFETVTLLLDSPGGDANAMNSLIKELKHGGHTVNTEIEQYAASAAAVLFTEGKSRAMHQDSWILFHRGRVMLETPLGEVVLTAYDMQTFLDTNMMPKTYAPDMVPAALALLVATPRDVIVDAVKDLTQLDLKMIYEVSTNLKMDQKKAETVLFPLGIDVKLTDVQALALGVATKIIKD